MATATSENTAAIAAVNAAKTADAEAKQKLKTEQDKVATDAEAEIKASKALIAAISTQSTY